MHGSRRVRATSVLPRSGPPSLFKGHLGTKSNAFCTDSSSLRLSTLHMVKNHMAVHYNKLLSAKAVVDCSIPVSMSTSIKYADQQRREKLKKELAQCEREMKLTKTAGQANSKNNSKSLFNTLQKPAGESRNEGDTLIEEVNGYSSFTRSPVTSSERLHLSLPTSNKVLTDGTEKNPGSFPSSVVHRTSGPRRTCSASPQGRSPRSPVPNSQRFQLVISKAPSGDLLDKHSKLFSNRHLPFTPRTLKTEAKSFLSQYRYYTPAKRKKDATGRRVEAETQTELSSFDSDFEAIKTKEFRDTEMNIKQASSCMTYETKEYLTPLPSQGNGLLWDKIKDSAPWCSSARTPCGCSMQLPPRRKIHSHEEELLYLSFIEDVTDEILKLGLFSNRSLDRLFERHIRQNKHQLEEGKMRNLLYSLKVNLGCISKENSEKLDDVDILNLHDLEKAEQSVKSEQDAGVEQEHQEYRKALGTLLSAPKDETETSSPKEFFLPIYKSKDSEGVIIQQVDDESTLGPSIWDEKNPNISDSLTDQETTVNVTEGDSEPEKVEASNELRSFSTALSASAQLCSVSGDDSLDTEEPTLKIMEMSIEDCSLDG